MKKNKTLILALVTGIMVIAAYFVAKDKAIDNVEPTVASGPFLQNLQGKTEQVTTVVIGHNGRLFKIIKQDNQWVISDKQDYPVDLYVISKIILGAEKLAILEKKTDDTNRLDKIGLDDPMLGKNNSSRIMLTDSTEKVIFADFIRGDSRKLIQPQGDVNAVYVRHTNENQAWLVSGEFDMPLDANTLLNKSLYAIESSRISSVDFDPPTGKNFTLTRSAPQSDFKISSGEDAVRPVYLNDVAAMLEKGLNLTDVTADSNNPESTEIAVITFKTYNGLSILLRLHEQVDGYWIKIVAESDNGNSDAEATDINNTAEKWLYKVSDESAQMLLTEFDSLIREKK